MDSDSSRAFGPGDRLAAASYKTQLDPSSVGDPSRRPVPVGLSVQNLSKRLFDNQPLCPAYLVFAGQVAPNRKLDQDVRPG